MAELVVPHPENLAFVTQLNPDGTPPPEWIGEPVLADLEVGRMTLGRRGCHVRRGFGREPRCRGAAMPAPVWNLKRAAARLRPYGMGKPVKGLQRDCAPANASMASVGPEALSFAAAASRPVSGSQDGRATL